MVPSGCPAAAVGTRPDCVRVFPTAARAESLVLAARRAAAPAGAVPADRCPSPIPCRKTAHPAASSTSSSARTGTASPCAGAATPMRTAWTAPMRRTAAPGVTAARRGSLGAGHLPSDPSCPLCPHCGWEHSCAPLCPASGRTARRIRALGTPQLCWKRGLRPQTGVLAARADVPPPAPRCHSPHVSPGRVPMQQHAVQAPGLEVRWGG